MWIVSHILQCFKLANPNSYARNVPSHCKHKKAAAAAYAVPQHAVIFIFQFSKELFKKKLFMIDFTQAEKCSVRGIFLPSLPQINIKTGVKVEMS